MYFARILLALPSLAAIAVGSFGKQRPLTEDGLTSMPLLGFGTWNLHGENATKAVSIAIQTGYRHVDCATAYGNQKEVGAGIADGIQKAGIKRSDLWITSKLWNTQHNGREPMLAIHTTLEDLGLQYLDLWLMHWPVATDADGKNKIDYEETWLEMNVVKRAALVHHIGVSNFSPSQLQSLISHPIVSPPDYHQFEMHPYLQQNEFLAWHKVHEIGVTAYSPLANLNPTYHSPSGDAGDKEPPMLLENEVLDGIADMRNCTPAQVALSWGMQRGVSVIPKSAHEGRIKENIGALECELGYEDHDTIGEVGERWLKRYNNPGKGWGVKLYEGLDDA